MRKYHRRAAQRKSTMFRVRGRDIQYSDLVRYCKRKRLSISEIMAQRAASKTPEAVICLTPVPSRVTTPSVLSLPEFLMSAIRDHMNGCFDSGTWIKTEERALCYSRNNLCSGDEISQMQARIFEAHCLTERGGAREAEIVLDSIKYHLGQVLFAEEPEFMWTILTLPFVLNRTEESMMIIKRLFSMFIASEVWNTGQQHPLRRTFEYIQKLEPSEFATVCTRCQQVVSDHFQKQLGAMHATTLHARVNSDHISLKGLRDLMHRCQAECGTYDPRTLTTHLHLARTLRNEGIYTEARDACGELLMSVYLAQEEDQSLDFTYTRVHAHQILATCQRVSHEKQESEANMREAILLSISKWGPHNSYVRLLILQLKNWLLEDGRIEEADEAWRWWRLLAHPPSPEPIKASIPTERY